MDKTSAQRLVCDTLQSAFDKERFVYLVRNILKRIEDAPFTYKGNVIFHDFAESIRMVERIGKYEDPEGKLLDILVVHLQKDTSLDRARTMQRNFVAKYLKGSRGGILKDAALVAFVAPGEDDWRFSLVKMEYKFNENGKVEEEFTPARRYSFLVGNHENSHTAQSRLLPILLNDEDHPTLGDLEDAFSVERVTKEFFEKYRGLFLRLKEALDAVLKRDAAVQSDFATKAVETVDFSKKLLGQIVFLYFLQKKGWFGVGRRRAWGSGSRHFLRELFEGQHGGYENYFNDILEPLFYEALRHPRDGDYFSRFDCRIPFLNGGLFDPLGDYDWWGTEILLPNEIFSNRRKTREGDIGDGILDIFDRYNFTVKEDEPLEKEVAVDPEMLGKVFENLLEVKDRKSKGTFYTPRDIVHYMCQESLTHYLVTGLAGKTSKEDVETLIRYGEAVVEHDSRVVSEGRETERYSFKLPEAVRKHAKLIDDKLASIRVCDPAVGSGAFPVGMMNEIIRTRNALTAYIGESVDRTSYHFKRHAIQDCLYGVDVDPGAVEIAKLRLWLSLVVDEEERHKIQPLPNLDYKIVQGNSLSGVRQTLFTRHLFSQLEELKPVYFNEANASKKRSIKGQIDEIIKQITSGHKDFDFEVYFSEVFQEGGGFDVVIGNPPYVGFQGFMALKPALIERFKTARGKFDYYVPFLERGLECLRNDGVLCFICPTNFIKRSYGKEARHLLLGKSIIQICDFQDQQIFERALNYTGIFLIQKRKPSDRHQIAFKTDSIDAPEFLVHQSALSDEPWIFQDPESQAIIVALDECRVSPLGDLAHAISEGIVTGQNEVFLVDLERARTLGLEDDLIHPCIRGRQIRRFFLTEITEAIIYPYRTNGRRTIPLRDVDLRKYPMVWNYLRENRNALKGRGYFEASSKLWYELWCQRDLRLLNNKKIVVPELAESNRFSLAPPEYFYGDTVCGITFRGEVKEDIRFILGLLNSKLLEFLFKKTTVPKANRFYIYKTMFLKRLPIARIDFSSPGERAVHDDLVDLVDRVIQAAAKEHPTDSIEAQIDQHVYRLYGLSRKAIRFVEEAVSCQ